MEEQDFEETLYPERDISKKDVIAGDIQAEEINATNVVLGIQNIETQINFIKMNDIPLSELITVEVGTAIATLILELWLRDTSLAKEKVQNITELLKSRTSDTLAQRRGARQFETIGEKVGENLLPLFEEEGTHLKKGRRSSVAQVIVRALSMSALSSEILAESKLEPTKLSKYILSLHPELVQSLNDREKKTYERFINEACIYIVDITSQLPSFTERNIADILKREDQLLARANQTLQELRRVREQLDPLAVGGRFEIDYRLSVARNLDMLQLLGTDVATANRRHRLSVAYITLSVAQKLLKRQKRSYSDAQESHREEISGNALSVDRALNLSRCLLISGLAGSGKTTLLQWIAVRSASRTFEGHLSDWNDTIPFYIRLRQCIPSLSGLPKPEAFPALIAPAIADTMPKGWVHNELKSGRALVLVDGLDEVATLGREQVRYWLKDLVDTYPQARFIITSRPHAIEENWMEYEKFNIAELQPMQLVDIFSFIEHWHKAVREELHDEEEKADLEPLAKHLKDEIRFNRSIRSVATNPLLCAMLCALNRERKQQLPTDRIELYEACCSLLLERRDKARGIDLSEFPPLNYRQKRFFLEDLAYWMIKNNLSEVTVQQIDERFDRKIINMPNVLQDVSGSKIRQLFVERTGIVREPVEGHIDFTHRTFQEYLAAQAASDETDTGVLITNAHNDQWREVIILACGLATKRMREDLIKGLIYRGDNEKKHQYQLHLLAVACLETSIEIEQVVKTEVENRLSELVPPKNTKDATAIAAAGDLAVKHLAHANYPPSTNAACVRALSLIGSEVALEMLEGYIEDPHTEVINELIRAWDAFDRETYSFRVLSRALYKLTDLHLENLPNLDGIQYITNLTSIGLSAKASISDFTPLESLTNLKSLDLSNRSNPEDISNLVRLTQIESLNLSNRNLDTLKPLEKLTQLKVLDLTNCSEFKDFSLGYLKGLSSISLTGCHNLYFLSVAGLEQLSDVKLSSCSQLSSLARLSQITTLTILESSELSDLSPLAKLKQLTTLSLFGCGVVMNLKPLSSLTHLTSLNLSGCYNLRDLSPLEGLIQITFLDLSSSNLRDLSPLIGLTQLRVLSLRNCYSLEDLSPLASLTQLESLDLTGCRQVSNLSHLVGLENLKNLKISRNFSKSTFPASFKKKVRIIVS